MSFVFPDINISRPIMRRSLSRHTAVKPLQKSPDRPIVTFTFDGFLKSAAETGAAIIEAVGGRACYYTSTALIEAQLDCGDMYDACDLMELSAAGHEIGAHTHDQIDCLSRDISEVLQNINLNIAALVRMGISSPITQFSYPFGTTDTITRQALAGRFAAARGNKPGLNGKGTDLMQLRAYDLGREDWTLHRAERAIEMAARNPAWVIINVHDVRRAPSEFGTTPTNLRHLVRLARDSGAAIQTPSETLRELGQTDLTASHN